MNLRDLKYIIALAETQHFGKAADRCFVSQPTLSGQIKKLEEELGVILFERTNRSVKVTPIGKEILEHAQQIMEQSDVIRQLALAHQDPLSGPLRIGVIPTLSPYLMPLILLPLKDQYPQMKLVLSEEMTDVVLERLHNHEIDAAFIATAVDDDAFDVVPLFDEPFWLAHPDEQPFYLKDKITQHDLNNMDLLLLAEGHCLAEQTMDICHLNDRSQQGEMADLRASSLETLLQLVAAGFGSTLVPALALNCLSAGGDGIVIRKLELNNAYRQISMVFRKSYPRKLALNALSKLVIESLPDSVKPLSSSKRKRSTARKVKDST